MPTEYVTRSVFVSMINKSMHLVTMETVRKIMLHVSMVKVNHVLESYLQGIEPYGKNRTFMRSKAFCHITGSRG